MKDRNISGLYRQHVWDASDELIMACVREGRSWRVVSSIPGQLWHRLYLFTDEVGWSSTWCDFPSGSVLVAGEVAL